VGCGNAIPEMTDTQRQAISEYAVEKVLEYDISKESRLVDLSKYPEPTPTPGPTPSPEPEGMDEVIDTPVIELEQENIATPAQALSLAEGVTLDFAGYEVVSAYPGSDVESFMVVEAGSGEKLLVMKFMLLNGSGQPVMLDMIGEKTSYLVTVNDTYSANGLITLLDDDLSTFYGELQPDEGKNLVLLAEFKEEEVLDVATIRLAVQSGGKATKVDLK
jgi:hypothetical protein